MRVLSLLSVVVLPFRTASFREQLVTWRASLAKDEVEATARGDYVRGGAVANTATLAQWGAATRRDAATTFIVGSAVIFSFGEDYSTWRAVADAVAAGAACGAADFCAGAPLASAAMRAETRRWVAMTTMTKRDDDGDDDDASSTSSLALRDDDGDDDDASSTSSLAARASAFAALALAPAVAEEAFFRAPLLLLGSGERGVWESVAMAAVSAALFGVVHVSDDADSSENARRWLYSAKSGAIYAALLLSTGHLAAPVAAHCAHNALVCAQAAVPPSPRRSARITRNKN